MIYNTLKPDYESGLDANNDLPEGSADHSNVNTKHVELGSKAESRTNRAVEHGPSAFDRAIIRWTAPDYIQHEKGWRWFLAAGIAVLILISYSVITQNWTLAVALIVLSALYVYLHFEQPKPVEIIISNAGIKAGKKQIPFQDIKSFWIIYDPPHVKTLNLKMNKLVKPDITIQLDNQDPSDLREFLCAQIYEVEGKKESFSDTLIRIFKL